MSKRPKHLPTFLSVAFMTVLLGFAARAEIKMTEMNGEWHGIGTSRELPVQSLEPTSCKAVMRADQHNMACDMACEGRSGLHKTIVLRAILDGERLAGSVSQRVTAAGGGAPAELNGTLTGHREGDTASFVVRWSSWQPSTTVALTLSNPNSFSMRVSALGITMMDVAFVRDGKH